MNTADLARIMIVFLAAVFLTPGAQAQTPQAPSSKGTAVCDCKPEFNVTAEGPGTCERAKDNTKWCRIKFNSGTGTGTLRQDEFNRTMEKFGLPNYDAVAAATVVNQRSPDRWDSGFLRENLPPLLAVALWDIAPERIRSVVEAISNETVANQILGGWRSSPPNAKVLDLKPYRIVASWGCIELVDRQFSVVVKTFYSAAVSGCAFKKP